MTHINNNMKIDNYVKFWKLFSENFNINIINVCDMGDGFLQLVIKDNFQISNSISIIHNYITIKLFEIVYNNLTPRIENNLKFFKINHLQQYKENL
jgi:hypothetical protein